MNNKEIAQLFREVAAAYTIKGENRFKIIAYERASDTIDHLSEELLDIRNEGKLEEIPGIGSHIASHVNELLSKGKVAHFEYAKKGLPRAMFLLLKLPGFGAKKAYKLAKTLNIKDTQDPFEVLKRAVLSHKIASIEGFGEKSEAEILASIESFHKKEAKLNRLLLPIADEIAQKIIQYLKGAKEVIKAEPLGSLRRMAATIGDIDIAVSTNKPLQVIDYFINYPGMKKIIEKGEITASILLTSGAQVDLMVQPPESFGSLLQHLTGSKNHNIKLRELALSYGLSLSEYGIKTIKKTQNSPTQKVGVRQNRRTKLKTQNYNSKLKIYQFNDEKGFYNSLGLDWIPPELRENTGEIEASLRQFRFDKTQRKQGKLHGLPKLVKLTDIKADLHLHSDYNLEPSHDSGESNFTQLLQKAHDLGYEYLSFSEHNPSSAKHSEQQIINIMKRRKAVIDNLKYSTKITRVNIVNMLEVDILPDGLIALPQEALNFVDALIIAVHSSFLQNQEEMTRRIVKALSFPKVKILGHPTGRLLEKRDGIKADWEQIFNLCKQKNIALEINANPYRLDLPDTLVRKALQNGNKFVISTDAHRIEEMDLMKYGVSVARRGWAEKDDILNSLGYNEFKKWLENKS